MLILHKYIDPLMGVGLTMMGGGLMSAVVVAQSEVMNTSLTPICYFTSSHQCF